MKFSVLVSSVLAVAPFLAGALPAAAQTQVVHVRAWIDGRSELILSGAQAQWQHFDFAAPGRLDCDTGATEQPTYVDADAWFPAWPDLPDCENRFCGGCFSDVYTGITPALPATNFFARLVPWQNRGDLFVLEQPHAANGYTTRIFFNDNALGGADWYEFDLYIENCYVESYCASTPCSSGGPAWMAAAGDFSIAADNVVLYAYNCAAQRPGIFMYGPGTANIPLANGRLCIDPFSGLHRLGVVMTDAQGNASRALSLASTPIVADSTWYFQYWFRDPAGGGAGSNLTDALRMRFCP